MSTHTGNKKGKEYHEKFNKSYLLAEKDFKCHMSLKTLKDGVRLKLKQREGIQAVIVNNKPFK